MLLVLWRCQSFDSINFPRLIVPRWRSSLRHDSGCMETLRVTAVLPLALADFLPAGRPAPLRGPPWVVDFLSSIVRCADYALAHRWVGLADEFAFNICRSDPVAFFFPPSNQFRFPDRVNLPRSVLVWSAYDG